MTNIKGKMKGTCSMFSRLFGKHSVVPLATNMRIYKKHDIVDIKGMGTVHKAIPHKCYHGNTGKSLQCHPACPWHCCKQTKKLRARCLPKEWLYTWSKLSTLKVERASRTCEGKWWEKENSQRKRYLGSTDAPACSTQKGTLWKPMGGSRSRQNPLPMNSWHDFKKQKPTKDLQTLKIFLLTEWKCGVPSCKEILKANFNCPNSVGDVSTIQI